MRVVTWAVIGLAAAALTTGPALAQDGGDETSHPGQYRISGPPGEAGDAEAAAELSEEARQTVRELSEWAKQPADGPEGRPLPVTGSWNVGRLAFKERQQGKEHPMREWGPAYFVEMIKQGHHVLPTFLDPQYPGKFYIGERDERSQARVNRLLEEYYRKPFEFAARHDLPIAFRDWNWIANIKKYERFRERWTDQTFSVEETSRLIKNGEPGRLVSPFGPVERWTEYGRWWLGNAGAQKMQEYYPDPPMVVLLDNNEVKVHWTSQITNEHTRFVEKYGKDVPKEKKGRLIREGYDKRMKAMIDAARDSLVEPAWKKNTVMVGYNNLWGTGYIGKGSRPDASKGFDPDPEKGWLQWRRYDGGMPELYDNDWQPGKTDHTPWSPQTEAMNYHSTQDWIFNQDPDFYWSSIVWDGGGVGNVWRGARRKVGKPYRYASRGQRYDFQRYEGMVQFCLWMARPRSLREFRGGGNRGAYRNGTWMALVRAVDRPWESEKLEQYWRHGEAVPNPDEEHFFTLEEDDPQWVRDLERWYMLTCDANPPRDEWTGRTHLRVFSMALRLGEKPERRWLIYAHAPLGAVADATVELPGYGDVTLESVPVSGSFFEVKEGEDGVTTVLRGGPAEIDVQSSATHVEAGQSVDFSAQVAHGAEQPFTRFTWSFGEGEPVTQQTLADLSRSFTEPGQHLVTVTGHVKGGGTVQGQALVWVDREPNERLIYELPLDGAFAWEGPWAPIGPEGRKMVTYRHLPNNGSLPEPILAGGQFTDDNERGTVLKIDGQHDGIWLALGHETVLHEQGHANKTISLRFKAADVQKRQVLYAQGHGNQGFNIYLDGGKVYAGSWSNPREWDGHWLSAEVKPNTWHQVTLVLDGATTQVQDDKQRLYLDGQQVAAGPGVRVPRQDAVPRIGRTRMQGRLMTRFHEGNDKEAKQQVGRFVGYLDDVRLGNVAAPPGE